MARRALASVVVALGCLMVLAGCDDSAGSQPHLGATIRVGVNLESSGGLGWFGQATRAGAEIAFAAANDAGGINGRQIEPIWVDNGTSSTAAVALSTKLMTQGKVVAVLGPATTDLFRLTLTVAEKQEVPVVSSLACNAGLLNRSATATFAYGFRSCAGYDFQGAAMAKFAAESLSAQTALVIRSADGPAGEFADAFTDSFLAAGGTVLGQETFAAGETDFARYVEVLQTSRPDVIHISGPSAETAQIIRTLRDAGVTQPILGTENFDSPALIEIAGTAALNKVYFTTNFTPLDTGNAKAQEFATAFQAAHEGALPNQANALAHDAALLIVDALKRADQITGVQVQQALSATRNLDGATGRLSIGPGHEVIKDALVIELVDGVPAAVLHVAP